MNSPGTDNTPSVAIAGRMDLDTMRRHIAALDAAGRIGEAIGILSDYRKAGGVGDVTQDVRALKFRAFACYNAHREAGQIHEAEIYAAALADLLPEHLAIVEAALECNRILGRPEKAIHYAVALLALDMAHPRAVEFLAAVRRAPETAALEIAHLMKLACAPHAGREQLYQLRELDAAASAILCSPLDAQRRAQLQQITDLAAAIPPVFPPGVRGARWESFYRLKLSAIDLPTLTAGAPTKDTDLAVVFCTADGAALDWPGVAATAARLNARVVFFAAADARYVARYARWYASSILASCDVPCMVIIHVIGGAANLPVLAASVGIADPRLIFAGDDFDANTATAKAVDSPLDTPHTVPVAHYQSVRFIRLGTILRRLQLPVFVSDIDTLLQRGVADLLQAHTQAGAETDVVFNENETALSSADRLTANLLLAFPTVNTLLFARFLRAYLEHHLQNPEVIRWIDQVGLLLGRHYLHGLDGARMHTFDTRVDINNVMYPIYTANPYRFLSLYQGFDMASLEPAFRR